MKVVILAGGYGTRISEESYLKPKPMIEIGEKTILWHIMKLYSHYGYNDFIICAGYKQHVIKQWFSDYYLYNSDVTFDFGNDNKMTVLNNISEPWKVTIVDTGLNTMTGGRIKRVKDYIGTSSFYPPHHMTMGEGGAVYTNDPLLHKIIVSFRDWGRDCICNSGQDNLCGHRYDRQYGELPLGYDHKYVYSHFGYNLKATEMQASIGVAQLDKLDAFTQTRKNNFKTLFDGLKVLEDKLILPQATENSDPSWFGFLITVKDGVNRNELVKFIEDHNIQTRMLFASNMILHPCFDQMREEGNGYRVIGDLKNTNQKLDNTFWIGVSPKMTDEKLQYMIKVIHEGLK